jgi:outer membrane protein insertion porin family
LAQLGTFTGATGNNSVRTGQNIQFVGADTQLLGNFEYRIPIFGPASLAAFADIGTAFNLRKAGTQEINSNFLPDQPFLQNTPLTSLLLSNGGLNFIPSFGFDGSAGILIANGEPVSRIQYENLGISRFATDGNNLPIDPTGSLRFQRVFLRGEAQTNTLVRVDDSALNKIGDFRSSIGLELRVQIPIVNAPFRLIYAYNPNAKQEVVVNGLRVPLREERSVFRFSVGRTF